MIDKERIKEDIFQYDVIILCAFYLFSSTWILTEDYIEGQQCFKLYVKWYY